MFEWIYSLFGYSSLATIDAKQLVGEKPSVVCAISSPAHTRKLLEQLETSVSPSQRTLAYDEMDERTFGTQLSTLLVDQEARSEAAYVFTYKALSCMLKLRIARLAQKRSRLQTWLILAQTAPHWDTLCVGAEASDKQLETVRTLCGIEIADLNAKRQGAEWYVIRREADAAQFYTH